MALSSTPRRFRICMLVVVAIALICAFIIYKGAFKKALHQTSFPKSSIVHSEKLSECRSVCGTEDCINFANAVMKNMNPEMDPCENFYSFACGGFVEKHGKNENYTTFENQADLMYVVLRDIIERSSGPVGSYTEKLKTVYQSCINEESSDMKSAQTFLQFLGEIGIPKWPNLNSDFTFENSSLEDVLGTLYSYRENIFFTFSLPFHRFPPKKKDNFTIKQQYNFDVKKFNAAEMETIVYEILNHLDTEISNASQIVEDYVEVDTSIQKLNKENAENVKQRCSNRASKRTYVDCTREGINDENLICNVLKSAVRSSRTESALNAGGYELHCGDSYYFEHIDSLISNFSHRALANYMALRIVMNNFEYMKFSLRRKLRSYFEIFSYDYESDRSYEFDKYKFCIQFLSRYMPYNLALIVAPKLFPGNSAEDINGIYNEIKNIAANIISQQNWIDDNKKELISKEVIVIRNEFYEEITKLNESELNRIYEMFEFNPRKENFFQNVLDCKRMYVTAVSSEFENYRLLFLPFDMEASYSGTMSLGVGFLLPPIYKYGADKLFNYAILAYVLGHETGHMIFHYLSEDNKHNETRQQLKERKSCLIEQYSNFFIETIGKYARANRTISEDFPDDLAMKFTERIVENYLANLTERFYLPGLPYPAEGFFYIASSQLWCKVMSIEMAQIKYEQDYHSPAKFRVIGALQNSEKFSRAFNCRPNSFMNPEKKCSVFDM